MQDIMNIYKHANNLGSEEEMASFSADKRRNFPKSSKQNTDVEELDTPFRKG
jgi:hypothetical protein